MKIRYLCTYALLLLQLLAYSQEMQRYSEEEVTKEDKYLEALSYILTQQAEKAEPILIDLYKDDRNNSSVALALSQTYDLLEDPANELRYAKLAAKNAPNSTHIQKTYGEISLDLEKYGEAVSVFESLAQQYPLSEEYTDLLATAHLYLNQYKKALSAYNTLEGNIGVKEEVSLRKYEIHQILNDDKAALKELQQLTSAHPANLQALHTLAMQYEKMGNTSAAEDTYRSILAIDINDTKANLALMSVTPDEAGDGNYLRALAPIIDNGSIPIDNKVLELIPYVEKLGTAPDPQLEGALIELAQRLVANHPTEAKSHAIQGDILFLSGKTTDAIKAYEKTLSIDDSVYPVWEQLIYAYLAAGRVEDASKTSLKAIDYYPNKATAYYLSGMSYRKLKKYDEAIDYLSEGALVAGRDIYNKSNILAELALNYQLHNNPSKANDKIAQSLEISQSQNPLAMERQGDILILQGNQKAAVAAWKEAAKLSNSPTLQEKITKKKYID